MKLLKFLSVLVAIVGVVALASIATPSLHGQRRDADRDRMRDSMVLAGRGAAIGVSIRDLERAEAEPDKAQGGVVIEEVRPDSPADKAGLKRSDVIVMFDGERVRSARQFSRLVQETPPGKTVKVTVARDGQQRDFQITPSFDRRSDVFIDGDRLRERFGDFADRLPNFNFDFDFDPPGIWSRGRLGLTVQELTPQLATYFGAKNGVLVSAVAEGSGAAQAGIRAGDVITSVNGENISSRADLTRALHGGTDREVTLGIVRDKKEMTIKATIPAVGSPVRPIAGRRNL